MYFLSLGVWRKIIHRPISLSFVRPSLGNAGIVFRPGNSNDEDGDGDVMYQVRSPFFFT